MQLYSLTLQTGGGIAQAIYGNFTGTARSHEFIVCRGKVLELLVPDESGEVQYSAYRLPCYHFNRILKIFNKILL